MNNLLSLGALKERLSQLSSAEKVVFTNGCFDLLHVGHVRYLKEARQLGDLLVVGLNSDSSVKGLKGPSRPLQTELDRAEILLSLRSVDYVTIFSDSTPLALVEELKPHIYVKGGDWKRESLPEFPVVTQYGGQVKILSFVEGRSTTNLVGKIQKQSD